MQEIYLRSLPQIIVDIFFPKLEDEVMNVPSLPLFYCEPGNGIS